MLVPEKMFRVEPGQDVPMGTPAQPMTKIVGLQPLDVDPSSTTFEDGIHKYCGPDQKHVVCEAVFEVDSENASSILSRASEKILKYLPTLSSEVCSAFIQELGFPFSMCGQIPPHNLSSFSCTAEPRKYLSELLLRLVSYNSHIGYSPALSSDEGGEV